MIKKNTLGLALCLLVTLTQAQTNAQELMQSIIGRVVDKDAESPLPGVNVVVLGSNTQIAASTNSDGY